MKSNKVVSIIGSGPSGLECARIVAEKTGHVTVYEAMPKFGGALRYGIPGFRLRKHTIDRKIDNLKELGVKFVNNCRIGKDVSFDELKGKSDVVFLALGANVPKKLEIEGENQDFVLSSIEFLEEYNSGIELDFTGKVVCVIGAGNVAMDAARVAVKLNAKAVKIVYRRTMEEAPCNDVELINAREEGIEFLEKHTPTKILDGVLVCNETTEIKTDIIITAIGQNPEKIIDNRIKVDECGRIVVDENMQTSLAGVYAGGDVVRGPETIRQAILDGGVAGRDILKALC